jgi:hypothetical protein
MALRPADCVSRLPIVAAEHADKTQHKSLQFRKTGKPGSRTKTTAKITARRKRCEWSALEKPVAPLTESATCRKIRRFVLRILSFSGAGEGIRTPDPLITNQMLYRLSYASKSRESCAVAQTNPSDPFRMSGTII